MLYAIERGVNYFDTAYPYHNGKSEVFLGKIIRKNDFRDKVYIADKLPADWALRGIWNQKGGGRRP